MPRTAPTVNNNPQRIQISFLMIDRSGDKRSVAITTTRDDVTNAEIDSLANALAALTQANLYGVSVERLYVTNPDRDDALSGARDSVYDNIVVLFKNATQLNGAVNFYIPAPISALLQNNTDIPNPNASGFSALTDAVEVILGDDWDDVSVRYTERREKNERVIL